MLRITTAVNKKCSAGLDLWGFLYDIHPNTPTFAASVKAIKLALAATISLISTENTRGRLTSCRVS